jgi:hypothetical protein
MKLEPKNAMASRCGIKSCRTLMACRADYEAWPRRTKSRDHSWKQSFYDWNHKRTLATHFPKAERRCNAALMTLGCADYEAWPRPQKQSFQGKTKVQHGLDKYWGSLCRGENGCCEGSDTQNLQADAMDDAEETLSCQFAGQIHLSPMCFLVGPERYINCTVLVEKRHAEQIE